MLDQSSKHTYNTVIKDEIAWIEAVLSQGRDKSLNDVQVLVVEKSWQGLTYQQIADESGYEHDYIKQIGAQLWSQLSEVLQTKITKSNLKTVLQRQYHSQTQSNSVPLSVSKCTIDWGTAADIPHFYGRDLEVSTLKQWILADHCRLITVLGGGGIGKSALIIHLAQLLHDQFDILMWRSLKTEPPFSDLLVEILSQLASSPSELLKIDTDTLRIEQLIHYLQNQRCLIILDNFDALFESGESCGELKKDQLQYALCLKALGSMSHQSCVVVTSREQPQSIDELEGVSSPVRSLVLDGLDLSSCQKILSLKGLQSSEEEISRLNDFYRGNPLALKIISTTIKDLFHSNISFFLREGYGVYKGLRSLLDEQFSRLSAIEKTILYWLAINSQPVSIDQLLDNLLPKPHHKSILEALDSLRKRSLIETTTVGDFNAFIPNISTQSLSDKSSAVKSDLLGNKALNISYINLNLDADKHHVIVCAYTLQPVLTEYLIEKFTDSILAEILSLSVKNFLNHPLIKAQSSNNIRDIQSRLIVGPLVTQLISELGSESEVIRHLHTLIGHLYELPSHQVKYAGGNVINLFRYLNADLTGYSFAKLPIRQAILQDLTLQNTNFSEVEFSKCLFANTFGGILCITFNPDGSCFATSDTNGNVIVWSVTEMKPIVQCKGHDTWTWSVAFHPHKPMLASCGDDLTIRLWDTNNGHCLAIYHGGHTSVILDLAFSPDGQYLVSTSNDTQINIWELATHTCHQTIHNNKCSQCLVYAPDGNSIYSGGEDCCVRRWDVLQGKYIQIFEGHAHWVMDVAISQDGQYLASASLDGTVKVWDTSTGQCLQTLQGHQASVVGVAFSPDAKTVVSGSYDQTVRLWDRELGYCTQILKGHTNLIWSVDFHPSSQLIASGGEDYTTRFWHTRSGHSVATLQGYSNAIYEIALHPDSAVLASGHEDQLVHLWNVSTVGDGAEVSRSTEPYKSLRGHHGRVVTVGFSPDGAILASGSFDRTIKLWNPATFECLMTLQGHKSWVWHIAFHPNSQILASASYDKTIRFWDVETGKCLEILECGDKSPYRLAFSPNGQWLVSGGYKQCLKFWDVSSGSCMHTWSAHENRIWAVTFSHNNSYFASAGEDHNIAVWDVDSKQQIQVLKGHKKSVLSVQFSQDDQYLFSSSADHTIKQWDLETGRCLQTLSGHEHWVSSIVTIADNDLFSGSRDGTVKVWNLNTQQLYRNLAIPRPYAGMNITGVQGITDGQQKALIALGAVIDD